MEDSVQISIPRDLRDRLKVAAAERMVSVPWLAAKGLEDFLAHLLPIDEVVWTRRGHEELNQ